MKLRVAKKVIRRSAQIPRDDTRNYCRHTIEAAKVRYLKKKNRSYEFAQGEQRRMRDLHMPYMMMAAKEFFRTLGALE